MTVVQVEVQGAESLNTSAEISAQSLISASEIETFTDD